MSSESFSIKGRIVVINELQNISEKFQKREFVIELDGKYPEFIKFEFVNEKCTLLDQYQNGMEVEVEFNLRGRKWRSPQGEDKYFNTLLAWRIKNVGSQQAAPPAAYQQPAPVQAPVQQAFQSVDESGDIPF